MAQITDAAGGLHLGPPCCQPMQLPHHGAAGGLAIAAAGFQKRHAGIEGHLHQRLQLIAAELVGLKDQFQRQAQLHHRRNLIVQGRELAIEQQGEVRY